MKKSQEAKFQILFMEKFQKKQEAKFENLTHENLAFFLGDVQPKMCGINFPKNKQSCYQLLSKTSKVVISCYRVNTSKNRVVIKNKQVVISCYQLLSSCYHVWVSTILAKNMSILRIQWLKLFHVKKCPFSEFNDWKFFICLMNLFFVIRLNQLTIPKEK